MSEYKPYCRGHATIYRALPGDRMEAVIDFRDVSLLPSVLFHLNGEYHDSQMNIRESVDLLREKLATATAELAARQKEVEVLRAACEAVERYHDPNGHETVTDHAAAIHEYVTLCRAALAAHANTAHVAGEDG